MLGCRILLCVTELASDVAVALHRGIGSLKQLVGFGMQDRETLFRYSRPRRALPESSVNTTLDKVINVATVGFMSCLWME